jgi:hypothetical protein
MNAAAFVLLVAFVSNYNNESLSARPYVGATMQEFASEESCKAAAKKLEEMSAGMSAGMRKPGTGNLTTACVAK